jgi:hypothetical protein
MECRVYDLVSKQQIPAVEFTVSYAKSGDGDSVSWDSEFI